MFTNTFNMDPALKDNFTNNTRIFKETLDRIIEKYINVGDGGIDVNIAKIQEKTLQRYMRLSRKNLKSQLDSTCEDDAVDETSGSNSLLDAVERDESSVEECGSRLFEFQPEDRDEGLQMSLSSHGSSLGELYPAMIRRMKKAWNGQQASVAASSVLRKYRRWRRQPKRSSLNSIFDVSLRHVSGSPKKMTSKGLLNSSYSSPGKKQLMRSKPTPGSALQTVISLYDGQVQQQSHGKEREQPYIRVMDLSAINKPEISLNDTFTVSTLPRPEAASLREQVPVFSGSPSRPYYAVAKASMDPSFKIREVSVPSHLAQTTMCPTYAPEVPAIKERPDVYCSPVRRSPFKTRMMPDHSPSPRALFKSCKDHVEHYSRESARPRSLSSSLSTTVSSSPERPVVQLRRLHPQDSHPSPQRQLRSPYSAGAADGHQKLRPRSLSSSLSTTVSSSPERPVVQLRMLHPQDLSAINKPKIPLDETFTVSTLPRPEAASLREQVPVFSGSPSRPYYAVAKASMDPSFKIREVSVPSHLAQTTMCPTYAPEVPAIKERPDVYCSPVRRSPFKSRMMPDHSPSPRALFKSCKDHVEHYSRESARPRSLSTSLSTTVSSSPERPVVQLRMLHSQDSHPSPKRELSSPYSAGAAVGHHKLRRHLSFDSAQPPKPISYLSEKVDEDFKKLYHKLMCENKSDYVNGPPCRLCAQSSEAGRGHSSSALAALALSPHRSVLRKRYRDWLWESHPRPKRFREEQYTHSPGSSRYMKQMLRPCLPGFPYESSNSSISGSPSKYRRHQPTMHQ
ncbi:uncharacterized protein si:dkeyp-117h8.4 [Cololabis saira]|uniref:uncharacterized protein si:dkeyp-117h8.4 n=1 Tax=Cololabis saira TaxID=129043 RepID=UPI002AD29D8E|nr:uncharacterized protein si:dkeyp-117h8.4 [Cololabis saira]